MDDCDDATIFIQPGKGWGVSFGGQSLVGFETAQDAYWWCVQALLIDPLAHIPERFRPGYMTYHKTEADSIAELPLFQEDLND